MAPIADCQIADLATCANELRDRKISDRQMNRPICNQQSAMDIKGSET
jgi:hypothetical protein